MQPAGYLTVHVHSVTEQDGYMLDNYFQAVIAVLLSLITVALWLPSLNPNELISTIIAWVAIGFSGLFSIIAIVSWFDN